METKALSSYGQGHTDTGIVQFHTEVKPAKRAGVAHLPPGPLITELSCLENADPWDHLATFLTAPFLVCFGQKSSF